MGKLPEPRAYLDNLTEEGKGREDFFKTALSFTPAGAGIALYDGRESISDGDKLGLTLAAAGVVLPSGVGKISLKLPTAASRAFSSFTEAISSSKAGLYDFLQRESDTTIELLQRAFRSIGPEHPAEFQMLKGNVGAYVETAPEARAMLHDFTATPRQLIKRQYPSEQAFNEALESARAYRATGKTALADKPLMDISDKALDRPVKVYWEGELLADDTSGYYQPAIFADGMGRHIGLGHHLAFKAAASKSKHDLIATAAHEARHALQDEGRRLAKMVPYYEGIGYHALPWEREVRRAELRSLFARATGKTMTTPGQASSAYKKLVLEMPEDIARSFHPTRINPTSHDRLVRDALGLLSAPFIAHGVNEHYGNRSGPLSRDQEKAIFAKGGRGGGARSGGGSARSSASSGSSSASSSRASSTPSAPASTKKPNRGRYIPANESPWWSATKAGWSGLWEGFGGGATILADKFTFGAIDSLSRAADSYKGWEYDVSRTSATVARESLLAAGAMGALSKAGKAWQGFKSFAGLGGKSVDAYASGLSAVGGFAAKSAIEDYRSANPAINPYADKALAMASTLAGYVGSMGAVGSGVKALGAFGRAAKIALSSSGKKHALSSYVRVGVRSLDKFLGGLKSDISSAAHTYTPTLSKVAGGLHRAYTSTANFTGSTIKDLINSPRAMSSLSKAKKLAGEATSRRTQADAIKAAARAKKQQMQTEASRAMADAHRASQARDPNARQMYRDAVDKYWKVEDAANKSARVAKKLTDSADKLGKKANALRADSMSALRKAAYVAAGITGVTVRDELAIQHYQDQQARALRDGTSTELPRDEARGAWGTLGAAAVGTLGNPIEKFFRPGLNTRLAEQGAYRANYDAITAARDRGELSPQQADAALEKLARRKPWQMEGTSLWQFAPAAAAFGNWKVGDAIAEAKRSNIQRVDHVHDADTIMTRDNPSGIRFQDINTPEIDNPRKGTKAEYLGDAAASRMKELVKPGQSVRIVYDSKATDRLYDSKGRVVKPHLQRPADGFYDKWGNRLDATVNAKGELVPSINTGNNGYDKYWRPLAVVETIPRVAGLPLDRLLDIPYLGKVIPAVDLNKKMVAEGLADIHWRDLSIRQGSGIPDRAQAYDKVRAAAQEAGIGVWSPEGRAALPWVGTEKTVQQRSDEYFRERTGTERPAEAWKDLMLTGGMGLMVTGNTGIFGMMPRSGTALAQTWNAALAAGGALEYNERARRTAPRNASRPRDVKTDYQRELDALMRAWGY